MNKKAASFSGWVEGIFMCVIVIFAFGLVMTDMNDIHGKNYSTGITSSEQISKLTNLQSQYQNKTTGGKATFGSDSGITLSSSWDMVVTSFTIIGDVLGGSWIINIATNMMIPPTIALLIRMLWLMSLGYIIMKILFKIPV